MNALEKELILRAKTRQADIRRALSDCEMTPNQFTQMMERLGPLFADAARCMRICLEGPTEADAKWLVWNDGRMEEPIIPEKHPLENVPAGMGVSGNATVVGNAKVSGNARVSSNAWVRDDAVVYDNAVITGKAQVFGNAEVFGLAAVVGNAEVSGNAKISGDAVVGGNARIGGTAEILGGTWDGSEGEITEGKWMAPGVPFDAPLK